MVCNDNTESENTSMGKKKRLMKVCGIFHSFFFWGGCGGGGRFI